MKPILFNTEMVRAILDGRKTVTRRVIKPQPNKEMPDNHNVCKMLMWTNDGKKTLWYMDALEQYPFKRTRLFEQFAPYEPGDIMYVRERFAHIFGRYIYRADYQEVTEESKAFWRPSIHMPKEAARLFLRVTNVRVERLWEMGVEDALMEGISPLKRPGGCKCQWAFDGCMQGPCENRTAYEIERHIDPMMQLWNSTIKKSDLSRYGWDANPWVWVISFERISKEE